MEKSKDQIARKVQEDPEVSSEIRIFLDAMNASGNPPLETLNPAAARQVLVDAQRSIPIDYSGIDEFELDITEDTYNIKLTIVKPTGNKSILPAFIFIHGGGWVLGDYVTHKRMVKDLVLQSGAACVFINYSLSPEAQFPQAINEIFAATKWIARNGGQIGIDGSRLAIVGNSAGGNMAAVTTLKAKENGGPEIKLQILMWPATNASFNTESHRLFGNGHFLTTSLMKWSYDNYTLDESEKKSIFISSLNASNDQLKGLPPALIQVADADILRDEGEAYGRKLDSAGVKVTTIRYIGTIHDFGLLNQLADTPQSKSLMAQASIELRNHLFNS